MLEGSLKKGVRWEGQEVLFEQLGEPNQDTLAVPERYERRQTASQPGSNRLVLTKLRQVRR